MPISGYARNPADCLTRLYLKDMIRVELGPRLLQLHLETRKEDVALLAAVSIVIPSRDRKGARA